MRKAVLVIYATATNRFSMKQNNILRKVKEHVREQMMSFAEIEGEYI